MNKKILKKLQEFIQKNKTITPRQFKLISEGKTPNQKDNLILEDRRRISKNLFKTRKTRKEKEIDKIKKLDDEKDNEYDELDVPKDIQLSSQIPVDLCGQYTDYGSVNETYFFQVAEGVTLPPIFDLNNNDICNETNAGGSNTFNIPQDYICCSTTNTSHYTTINTFQVFGPISFGGDNCYCPSPYCENEDGTEYIGAGCTPTDLVYLPENVRLMHCNNDTDGDGQGDGIPTNGNSVNHWHSWINQIAGTGGSISSDQVVVEGQWQFNDDLTFSGDCNGCMNEYAENYNADAGYTFEPSNVCEFNWCDTQFMNGLNTQAFDDTSAYLCNIYPQYCNGQTNGTITSATIIGEVTATCQHTACLETICEATPFLCIDPTGAELDTFYDGYGTFTDEGCVDDSIYGCMNPNACNYDSNATVNNGSCEFASCVGCMDSTAVNFDPDATISSGVYSPQNTDGCCYVAGCMNNTQELDPQTGQYYYLYNFDPDACFDDGSCDINTFVVEVEGCPEPLADNYNPTNPANTMGPNGCDMTNLCMDPLSNDYVCYENPELCVSDDILATEYPWNSLSEYGVTSSEYFYINNIDNPDYQWSQVGYFAGTYTFGEDFPNCTYPLDGGCTYESAFNYNPDAEEDDGSCAWYFCNDPDAFNYYDGISPYGESFSQSPNSIGCGGSSPNPDCPSTFAEYDDDGNFTPGLCMYEGCPGGGGVFDPVQNISIPIEDVLGNGGVGTSPQEIMPGVTNEAGLQVYLSHPSNYGCQPDGIGIPDPQNYECCFIPGCTLEEAFNYAEYHTVPADDTCALTFGCTDPAANNYDSNCTEGAPNYCLPFGTDLHNDALNAEFGGATDAQGFTECDYPVVVPDMCVDITAIQCNPDLTMYPPGGTIGNTIPNIIDIPCTRQHNNQLTIEGYEFNYRPGHECFDGVIPGSTGGGDDGLYPQTYYFDPEFIMQGKKGWCRPNPPGPMPDSVGDLNYNYWWKFQTPGATPGQSGGMNVTQAAVASVPGYPQTDYEDAVYHPPSNPFGFDTQGACESWCFMNKPLVRDLNAAQDCYVYSTMAGADFPATGNNQYTYAGCAVMGCGYGDYDEVGVDGGGDFDTTGGFTPGATNPDLYQAGVCSNFPGFDGYDNNGNAVINSLSLQTLNSPPWQDTEVIPNVPSFAASTTDGQSLGSLGINNVYWTIDGNAIQVQGNYLNLNPSSPSGIISYIATHPDYPGCEFAPANSYNYFAGQWVNEGTINPSELLIEGPEDGDDCPPDSGCPCLTEGQVYYDGQYVDNYPGSDLWGTCLPACCTDAVICEEIFGAVFRVIEAEQVEVGSNNITKLSNGDCEKGFQGNIPIRDKEKFEESKQNISLSKNLRKRLTKIYRNL